MHFNKKCSIFSALMSANFRFPVFSCIILFLFYLGEETHMAEAAIQLNVQDDLVIIDNGIVQVTLTNPGGILVGIKYGGIDNLLETNNKALNGGFWDLNWSEAGSPGTRGKFDTIKGTSFKVIVQDDEQVELSFTRTWSPSVKGEQAPLSIDRRFIVLEGFPGLYSYAIFEHLKDMPGFNINTTRIAFMLSIEKFRYMAVADNRQRHMPLPEDRVPPRGQPLDYPEAVLLVDPIEPDFQGEVDDKYQYSLENEKNRVHGWICGDPPVGFWLITPSNEFRNGGPPKQDLSSHVNPTTLAIFHTSHYAGEDLLLKFEDGEVWKKVLGPVCVYLNSAPDEVDPQDLWDDAKQQMNKEVESWPYTFPASEDFPTDDGRGSVSGTLLVLDRFVDREAVPGVAAYVGLAAPGDAGSWQRESKGYQFWTVADDDGCFVIQNIRPGNYNLYAWVPGYIGDYKYETELKISAGCEIKVDELVYEPPRDGPTIWEIGSPDRLAAEFYIPDPNPMYINKLYVNHPDRFRQYGLWERYAELYPDEDLIYNVGVSDCSKDWFFAQVTRKLGDGSYKSTTWQIRFTIDNVEQTKTYKLRIALASAHNANLEVRVNDIMTNPPLFSTGSIGSDNAIARHGIHGLYWLFSADIPGSNLVEGENNTIFLTQAKASSPFQGVMYDYIRLEGPSLDSSSRQDTQYDHHQV